jgi:hypothetical protein
MATAQNHPDASPLLDDGGAAPAESSCWHLGPGNRTGWRGGFGSRRVWKAVCTVVLTAEFAGFLYVVHQRSVWGRAGDKDDKSYNLPTAEASVANFAIFLVTFLKYLVEIWGQETPTWVCPGTFLMFFIIYGLIFPGVAYSFGYCTQDCDVQRAY